MATGKQEKMIDLLKLAQDQEDLTENLIGSVSELPAWLRYLLQFVTIGITFAFFLAVGDM